MSADFASPVALSARRKRAAAAADRLHDVHRELPRSGQHFVRSSADGPGTGLLRRGLRFRGRNLFHRLPGLRDSRSPDCRALRRPPLDGPHPDFVGLLLGGRRTGRNVSDDRCRPDAAASVLSGSVPPGSGRGRLLSGHHRLPDPLVFTPRPGAGHERPDSRDSDCAGTGRGPFRPPFFRSTGGAFRAGGGCSSWKVCRRWRWACSSCFT